MYRLFLIGSILIWPQFLIIYTQSKIDDYIESDIDILIPMIQSSSLATVETNVNSTNNQNHINQKLMTENANDINFVDKRNHELHRSEGGGRKFKLDIDSASLAKPHRQSLKQNIIQSLPSNVSMNNAISSKTTTIISQLLSAIGQSHYKSVSRMKPHSMIIDNESDPTPYARYRRYVNGCCAGRSIDYFGMHCDGQYRNYAPCGVRRRKDHNPV
jgi:hypothetical protein